MVADMIADGEKSSLDDTVGKQPFYDVAAEALAAEPQAATVSDATEMAHERARCVNFRDLHTVSPIVQPGHVYRSSQVVSVEELESLGISAILDLRQPAVTCRTHGGNLRQAARHVLQCGMGKLAALLGRDVDGSEAPHTSFLALPCHRCTESCCEHYGVPARVYHVDLLPTRVSLRILWELPRSLQAKVLWAAARRKHPEPIVAGAVADPQVMGYLKLYTILLERAQAPLAEALRLFADLGNYPALVHCIHGKDRTGLVAMLLLLLSGVEREAVVKDYALSEVLLREGREKRQLLGLPEHLTTDQIMASAAAVMEQTIDHLEDNYGSTYNYLKHVGLTDEELKAIVHNLTHPGLQLPALAAAQPACSEQK